MKQPDDAPRGHIALFAVALDLPPRRSYHCGGEVKFLQPSRRPAAHQQIKRSPLLKLLGTYRHAIGLFINDNDYRCYSVKIFDENVSY